MSNISDELDEILDFNTDENSGGFSKELRDYYKQAILNLIERDYVHKDKVPALEAIGRVFARGMNRREGKPVYTEADIEREKVGARIVELDLLEQAINQGRDMNEYKMLRLKDITAQLKKGSDNE